MRIYPKYSSTDPRKRMKIELLRKLNILEMSSFTNEEIYVCYNDTASEVRIYNSKPDMCFDYIIRCNNNKRSIRSAVYSIADSISRTVLVPKLKKEAVKRKVSYIDLVWHTNVPEILVSDYLKEGIKLVEKKYKIII